MLINLQVQFFSLSDSGSVWSRWSLGWWTTAGISSSYCSVLTLLLVALIQTARSFWDCFPFSLRQTLAKHIMFTMQPLNHNCLATSADWQQENIVKFALDLEGLDTRCAYAFVWILGSAAGFHHVKQCQGMCRWGGWTTVDCCEEIKHAWGSVYSVWGCWEANCPSLL